MPLHRAWLLAPDGYRLNSPDASASLSIAQRHLQSLVECRKMELAFGHPSKNVHCSGCSGSRKHHATRCSETSYRREDSAIPSKDVPKETFVWIFSRPIVLPQNCKFKNLDKDTSTEETAGCNLTLKQGCLLTAIKVLHTQFVLGMDHRKVQVIAKTLAILSLQGRTEALASTIATQGVNDILGGDFKSGFASAMLLIFFSELGDKTFFIAALLATRKSNLAVFIGTFAALVAMTFISVVLGRTFHYLDGVLPFSLGDSELPLDDLVAVGLLIYFGISSLVEAGSMKGSKAEEEQQEAELAIAGVDGEDIGMQADAKTVIATFALVFAAEWGDKSFFSTIALAAASSPVGVVTGAIAGHGAATALAVLGGSVLGTFVSEKIIASTGGILFLIFAGITLVEVSSGSK